MALTLKRFGYYIVITMLFLLPFHAFFTVLLNYGVGLRSLFQGGVIINMWKEIVLVILGILLAVKVFDDYRKKALFFDVLDWVIVAYIGFGLIHFMVLKSGLLDAALGYSQAEILTWSHLIWGAKYDFLFLIAFLIARHFRFSAYQVKNILKTVLIAGFISLLTAFVLYFIVKPESLISLGFQNNWEIPEPLKALSYCLKLENRNLCRMSGTFAGPNQFGAYIIILLPLGFLWLQKRKDLFTKKFLQSPILPLLFLALAIGALVFTFSRSAYLGSMVAIFTLGLFNKEWRKWLLVGTAALGVAGVIFILFFLNEEVRHILFRPESTAGHFQGFVSGLQAISNYPWGQGLGTSGPASSYIGKPVLTENWYLQIGIELGIIGLILWLSVLILILKKLKNQPHLFVGLLGLMVAAFFLHTFEDAPTTLTFFTLAGAVLGQSIKNNI